MLPCLRFSEILIKTTWRKYRTGLKNGNFFREIKFEDLEDEIARDLTIQGNVVPVQAPPAG